MRLKSINLIPTGILNYSVIKISLLALILTASHLFALQRPGATFLLIPPTAKATGMAYAWTAIADDASANYYNCAGLAFQYSPSLSVTYFKYLPGLHPDMLFLYFTGAFSVVNSAWGFDFILHTAGKAEVFDSNGNYLGDREMYDICPKITFSRKFRDCFSIGMGFKFIYSNYQENPYILPSYRWIPNKTYAFDFNGLFRILPSFFVGTVLHNLGPNIIYTASSETDPLPRLFRMGIAYKLADFDNLAITVSGEITKILVGMFANKSATFFENLKYELKEAWKGVGGEIKVYEVIRFRLGYFYDYERQRKGITFGGGIKMKGLEFDLGIDEKIFDFKTQNRKICLTYTF